jgi:hypothetical protein
MVLPSGAHGRAGEQVAGADEVGHETRAGKAVQLVGRVDLLHAPAIHDGDAVRQRERLRLVVRHVHERDARLLLHADELELHLLAQLGVERCERLVEQQHLRMRDEGARDRDTLALPARELVRKSLVEAREADVGERLVDLARGFGRGRPGHAQRERDVALDGHVREQRVALEHRADGARFRGLVREVVAAEDDAPAVGRSKPPIMRKSVVLPQPEGPRRVKNSPASIASETPSTATKSPKRRVTFSISSSATGGGLGFPTSPRLYGIDRRPPAPCGDPARGAASATRTISLSSAARTIGARRLHRRLDVAQSVDATDGLMLMS